ncbi:MAG: pirin family protein [Deltaproteobacteria bacterium]
MPNASSDRQSAAPAPPTPCLKIRRAVERGRADFGWLDSRHTFSFGHYRDPDHMGFGPLRVINDDRIAGGGGFPEHPHGDMEILSYVLEGALAHKDSLGNGSVIRPGDVQRLSAGTGVRHSEFNASQTDPAHFLQIWILPEKRGLRPSYEQKSFPSDGGGLLRLVGSREGRNGSVTIHQDVDLFAAALRPGQTVTHRLEPGRLGWVQVARGTITLNGERLAEGDGAAVDGLTSLVLKGIETAEILLFDMTR